MTMMMMTTNKTSIQHHHHVSDRRDSLLFSIFSCLATHTSSMLKNSNNPEQTRIYNQAVLLNSLIRNMVNDQPTMDNDLHQSTSNESCQSDQSQVNEHPESRRHSSEVFSSTIGDQF